MQRNYLGIKIAYDYIYIVKQVKKAAILSLFTYFFIFIKYMFCGAQKKIF